MVAYAGTAKNSGTVTLPADPQGINAASSTGAGLNGDVVIIAGATSGTAYSLLVISPEKRSPSAHLHRLLAPEPSLALPRVQLPVVLAPLAHQERQTLQILWRQVICSLRATSQ